MATVAMIAVSGSMIACEKKPVEKPGGTTVTPAGKETLPAEITSATTLNASKTYSLKSGLIVKNGASLTIPAGTRIEAAAGATYILVDQGAKIFVNGTASKPVVMTADTDKPYLGYWGGLVINGKAPLTGTDVNVDTEVNPAYKYGGTDANDNSGVVEYLKIEYPGYAINKDVEFNGFTLNGVGKATKIENVAIIGSGDDGIEFYGGNVDVTNLLIVNSDDDMFDFTRGHKGVVTNAYGVWEKGYTSAESDPNGIEADGNLDGDFGTHTGQSNFTVKNLTIDVRIDYVTGDNTRRMQSGLRIRRKCIANIENGLLKGTGRVETFINLSDVKGGADKACKISMTNALTTPADKEFKYNEGMTAADYTDVKVVAGNTGCDPAVFAWTGVTL